MQDENNNHLILLLINDQFFRSNTTIYALFLLLIKALLYSGESLKKPKENICDRILRLILGTQLIATLISL